MTALLIRFEQEETGNKPSAEDALSRWQRNDKEKKKGIPIMKAQIYVSADEKTFHLTNGSFSYIFQVLPDGHLSHVWSGKAVRPDSKYTHFHEVYPRPMTSCPDEGSWYSHEHTAQEYGTFGSSDFRSPALEIRHPDGSTLSDFRLKSWKITDGKPALKGLPATYCEDDGEAKTLQCFLFDEKNSLELILSYTIFSKQNVIARNSRLINHGKMPVYAQTVHSLCLDLGDSDYEWMQFSGAWGRERHLKNRKLEQGITSIGSRRGHSSHNHNPVVLLKRENTDENQGEALGIALVYSGNFLIQAECDTYDQTRILAGIHPDGFSWKLEHEEEFQSPEALLVWTEDGLNALSQTFHALFQKRLARGYWRDRPRPILANNWEATMFDFDEDKLVKIASKAKECGVELFVLDDGWFGARRNDRAGLGDWVANPDLLPRGISGLSRRIRALGMEMGLWFEPEMVNKDSDLYRSHPDWILEVPERQGCHGRNQFVLDFSRKEVVDAIFEMMCAVLDDADLSYIKWDMNRSITDCYSNALPADRQQETAHRYILGVYDLYERLIQRYPKILFESCASGGGRFDPGMLYYAPQAWCSDDSDAVERLKIQYGTSYVYPISSIGAHVSEIPNQQVYRNVPLHTRANVACFGTSGYELDLNKLEDEEIEQVREQILFMKENRKLLQFGRFYRLQSPFDGNITSWMVISEDKKEAIVGWYRTLSHVNQPTSKIRLQGLDPNCRYSISTQGDHPYQEHAPYGDELMHIGMITSDGLSGQVGRMDKYYGDFDSRLYRLKAIEPEAMCA